VTSAATAGNCTITVTSNSNANYDAGTGSVVITVKNPGTTPQNLAWALVPDTNAAVTYERLWGMRVPVGVTIYSTMCTPVVTGNQTSLTFSVVSGNCSYSNGAYRASSSSRVSCVVRVDAAMNDTYAAAYQPGGCNFN